MQKFLDRIAGFIPAKLSGRLDYRSHHMRFFFPYGGPMNGQTARLEIVREIIEYCGVNRIIETGTYRGTTTEWFSSFNIPVLSFEVIPRFAEFSRRRLRKRPHVQIKTSNSVEGLKNLTASASDIILFYLDAHWYDYLPLRDEYALIQEKFPRSIIIVDDFKVPTDTDYTYDDYGADMQLTLEYMESAFMTKPSVFFPAVKAKWETGQRRGTVIVTTDASLAKIIESKINLLAKWPL